MNDNEHFQEKPPRTPSLNTVPEIVHHVFVFGQTCLSLNSSLIRLKVVV